MQSGGPVPSGYPVGRAAVSGVVAAANRNEVKVRRWCGKVSVHHRSAWKDAGLSTARRERTRDSQPDSLRGAGGVQQPNHGHFAFVHKDFISYDEHGFLL